MALHSRPAASAVDTGKRQDAPAIGCAQINMRNAPGALWATAASRDPSRSTIRLLRRTNLYSEIKVKARRSKKPHRKGRAKSRDKHRDNEEERGSGRKDGKRRKGRNA